MGAKITTYSFNDWCNEQRGNVEFMPQQMNESESFHYLFEEAAELQGVDFLL